MILHKRVVSRLHLDGLAGESLSPVKGQGGGQNLIIIARLCGRIISRGPLHGDGLSCWHILIEAYGEGGQTALGDGRCVIYGNGNRITVIINEPLSLIVSNGGIGSGSAKIDEKTFLALVQTVPKGAHVDGLGGFCSVKN